MYIYQKAKLIDPLNTLPINLIATYVCPQIKQENIQIAPNQILILDANYTQLGKKFLQQKYLQYVLSGKNN